VGMVEFEPVVPSRPSLAFLKSLWMTPSNGVR